jgi:hypothetical protein
MAEIRREPGASLPSANSRVGWEREPGTHKAPAGSSTATNNLPPGRHNSPEFEAHSGGPRGSRPCRGLSAPDTVTIVDAVSRESTWPDEERLEATRLQLAALARRSEEAMAQAREIQAQVQQGRSQREILHHSAFARLQARMDSMPVIEQAKGIVMAQQRCGPDEAFDLLRRASQRANVKVHVLAARIVEKVSAGDDGDLSLRSS